MGVISITLELYYVFISVELHATDAILLSNGICLILYFWWHLKERVCFLCEGSSDFVEIFVYWQKKYKWTEFAVLPVLLMLSVQFL